MTDPRDAALTEIERLGQVWHKYGLLDSVSPAHADWLLAVLEGHKATLERHAPSYWTFTTTKPPEEETQLPAPVCAVCGRESNLGRNWPCPDVAVVLDLYTGAEP